MRRVALAVAVTAAALGVTAPASASGLCVRPTRVHHVCVHDDRVCFGSTRPPDFCVPLPSAVTG